MPSASAASKPSASLSSSSSRGSPPPPSGSSRCSSFWRRVGTGTAVSGSSRRCPCQTLPCAPIFLPTDWAAPPPALHYRHPTCAQRPAPPASWARWAASRAPPAMPGAQRCVGTRAAPCAKPAPATPPLGCRQGGKAGAQGHTHGAKAARSSGWPTPSNRHHPPVGGCAPVCLVAVRGLDAPRAQSQYSPSLTLPAMSQVSQGTLRQTWAGAPAAAARTRIVHSQSAQELQQHTADACQAAHTQPLQPPNRRRHPPAGPLPGLKARIPLPPCPARSPAAAAAGGRRGGRWRGAASRRAWTPP